jgi:hypothetical protein
MYEITKDIKPMHTREKSVSLSEPITVTTVTCVNTCPSARKQEGKGNAIQRFETLFLVLALSVVAH